MVLTNSIFRQFVHRGSRGSPGCSKQGAAWINSRVEVGAGKQEQQTVALRLMALEPFIP